MKLEIPEFANWKEEAAFWDRLDTAPYIADEEGEWLGPGRVQATSDLCSNYLGDQGKPDHA
jgi:hypothetical protein